MFDQLASWGGRPSTSWMMLRPKAWKVVTRHSSSFGSTFRPTKIMGVTGLLDQIDRDSRFRSARTHPARRRGAEVFRDCVCHFGNNRGLVILPQTPKRFSIGPAVAAHVVVAELYAIDDIGVMFTHKTVEQDGSRQLHLIEHTENAPYPDAQSVVAPSVIALSLWGAAALYGIITPASKKSEMLDVESNIKSQSFALGPVEVTRLSIGE
jgi:hypothetical protein